MEDRQPCSEGLARQELGELMAESDWNFYFITDSSLTKQGVIQDVRDAIRGGAKIIQYREKTLPEISDPYGSFG